MTIKEKIKLCFQILFKGRDINKELQVAEEKEKEIARLEKQMKEAARMMEYEYAAILRDQIIELRGNN